MSKKELNIKHRVVIRDVDCQVQKEMGNNTWGTVFWGTIFECEVYLRLMEKGYIIK